METKNYIGVSEKPPLSKTIPLSLQHLFAMFGSTVLVPILFKVDPATVLLFNGIGTLFYIFFCKRQIPAYLGSSFALIAPVLLVSTQFGYEAALGGFIAVGLTMLVVAGIIQKAGMDWINTLFPPAAMGSIVAVIGLELMPVAAKMSGFLDDVPNYLNLTVAVLTLVITLIASVAFRGFLGLIPILVGLVGGSVIAACLGLFDLSRVSEAPFFALPTIYTPAFVPEAVLIIVPTALVIIVEHVGHLVVTGNIVGSDLVQKPGLHRSLAANGISTLFSAFFGSTPNTTYGENIGVLAISKVYSTYVIGGAEIFSIILSCFGKVGALIASIPVAVMGGVSFLLFGIIAASGLRILVDSKVDYSKTQNLMTTAVVLGVGVSDASISIGACTLTGMTLSTIVAILVSAIFGAVNKLRGADNIIEGK